DGRSTMRHAARQLLPRIRGKRHSPERDRRAVTFHYDVSNDFYRLWLDRQMVYSCAYFRSPCDDLDVAQEQKLDYICRKLRLRAGQRLLDIGSGWGALVIHAAKNFGVYAEGITLSAPQAERARARIAEAGLANEAKIELRDYREISGSGSQLYDAIVSVGMAEHVGRERLPDYFVDEATYRVWRLYIAGSAHGFRRGHIAVYQTLLAKLDPSGQMNLPLIRDDWYTQKPGM